MADKSGQAVAISEVAVFVPFRIDSRDRMENLSTLLRHHRARFPEIDIHLVEDAAEPSAEAVAAAGGATYHFHRNAGNFHKTRVLNHAFFTLTDKPFVAALDTDVLLHAEAVTEALALLGAGASVVQPFDGRFFNVTGALRSALRADPDAAETLLQRLKGSDLDGEGVADIELMNRDCTGASVIFRRSALEEVGGFCELFTRWGFEDTEILARTARFGFPLQRVADWPVLHLAHPRLLANWRWYWMAGVNRRLYRRMGQHSRDEIEAMKRKGLLGPIPGVTRPA